MEWVLIATVIFLGWGKYLNRQESKRERNAREWRETPWLWSRG